MTMESQQIPGPGHPITVEPYDAHVTIRVAGQIVADTTEALLLTESSYPAVLYIPRKDVQMHFLTRSHLTTYCPFKGECSYYHIPSGGPRSADAVWTYEEPYEAVASIKEYLAFYPNRVDAIDEQYDS